MTTQDTTTPKLYVGTYAKYNNGSIEGKWLDLTEYEDAKAFWTACKELHKDEADPEFMFQDFEGFPKEMYSESMNGAEIENIIDYAKLDEDDRTLIEEYIDATGYAFEDADLDTVNDAYEVQLTEFNREQEYGEYLIESGVFEIDQNNTLANYIDYEKLGRDCLMDCSVSTNGYVFRSN